MENYLSPRKSWMAVAIVCALSAAALLAGRTLSPVPAAGADDPDSAKMKALVPFAMEEAG
jgi:hypothetical protein